MVFSLDFGVFMLKTHFFYTVFIHGYPLVN